MGLVELIFNVDHSPVIAVTKEGFKQFQFTDLGVCRFFAVEAQSLVTNHGT